MRNPPHVHQPLIQTIVDELAGVGRCESTGESGARASWVLEQCVAGYYGTRGVSAAETAEVGMHQVKDKNEDLHGNVPESRPSRCCSSTSSTTSTSTAPRRWSRQAEPMAAGSPR